MLSTLEAQEEQTPCLVSGAVTAVPLSPVKTSEPVRLVTRGAASARQGAAAHVQRVTLV